MKKHTIIDKTKCIGCGLCVSDCVSRCITLKDGKAEVNEPFCIGCGHCYALCPQNAVELTGWGEPIPEPSKETVTPEALMGLMKRRRSTRQFQDKPVPQEVIDQLLEAARYCPTAENHQVVEYIILDEKKAEIEAMAVEGFRKAKKLLEKLVPAMALQEIDDHFFFKNAPLVILVTNKAGMDDGLAASYLELMASSLGLGVLYSGFFRVAVKFNSKLKKLLKIRKGYHLTNCMVIGYPKVKYQRVPPRFPVQVRKR